MCLLFLKQGIEKWRHRLQKLESIGFPESTGVERVYTEKNRHSESVKKSPGLSFLESVPTFRYWA